MAIAAATVLLTSALGATSASAGSSGGEALPTYDGRQFPAIKGAADPESYSWRVDLGPRQTLRSSSDTEAVVEYTDGTTAFIIHAEKAHDFEGADVPTTLEVSEEDALTVVVHHLEGSYVYPVTAGEGWTGTYETTIIKGPPDEKEIEEARRRIEEANEPAEILPVPEPTVPCEVPALQDLSLAAAKARLRAAHCSVGRVHLAAGATAGKGKVVKQFRAAGTELPAKAPVAVKLGGSS